jgi:hypothetical protein
MLRLRTTEDGGRSHGIADGYRAAWMILYHGGEITYNDGPIGGLGERELAPGEAADVLIFPLVPELWQLDEIRAGRDLVMMEEPTVVGMPGCSVEPWPVWATTSTSTTACGG